MSNVQKKVVVDKMHPSPPQNIPASSFCRQYQDLTSQLDLFVSFPWNTDLTNIRIRIRCKFGNPSIHENLKTWEMSVLRNGLYELCQLQELVLENMVKIVRLVKLVNLTKLVNLMKLATLVKLSNLMRLVKLSNLVNEQVFTLASFKSAHCQFCHYCECQYIQRPITFCTLPDRQSFVFVCWHNWSNKFQKSQKLKLGWAIN